MSCTKVFLREVYDIPAGNAHRALDDVMVLYHVFSKMTDDLPIETVYALLQQNKVLTRMPFGKHQGKSLNQVPANYVQWLSSSGAFDRPGNEELKSRFQTLGLLTV